MLESKNETLRCPSCSMQMHLVRVVPRLGGLAELRSYKCKSCGTTLTRFADEQLNLPPIDKLVAKGSDIGC